MDNSKLNKPYVKATIIISIVIITLMFLTQSIWMNFGIKTLYNEYPINKVDELEKQQYIISGNYNNDNYLYDLQNNSERVYILTNPKINCELEEGYVKLLVMNEVSRNIGYVTATKNLTKYPSNVMVLRVLEGCK